MLKTLEEIFKNNLLHLRAERTQSAIAELAGIPLRSYQRCEYGDIPQGPNRLAIAKALRVEEGDLFVDRDRFMMKNISPEDALEIVSQALRTRSAAPSLSPRIASLVSAIEAEPSLLDDVETLVGTLASPKKTKLRARAGD